MDEQTAARFDVWQGAGPVRRLARILTGRLSAG